MFDFSAVDQLELSGKPATIQTVIDALWADDFHEQEPMTGAPEVCLCWVCQSLVPALKQVEQAHETELAALRERVGELEDQQTRSYHWLLGIHNDIYESNGKLICEWSPEDVESLKEYLVDFFNTDGTALAEGGER